MPSVVRLGDNCTGHGCHPPRPNVEASGDVFVNSKGAHRVGDGWATHTCGLNTHSSVMAEGSSTVFVNSKPLARVGDNVACGSAAGSGSGNVFAG